MNKYAKLYTSITKEKTAGIAEDLGKYIGDYKPMNMSDAIGKGMPVGAMAGGIVGGIRGLTGPDEYDPNTGEKKSKIKKAIVEALLGAGVGATAMAATPVLAKGVLDLGGRAAMASGKGLAEMGAEGMGKSLFGTGLKSRVAASPVGQALSLKQLSGIFTGNK